MSDAENKATTEDVQMTDASAPAAAEEPAVDAAPAAEKPESKANGKSAAPSSSKKSNGAGPSSKRKGPAPKSASDANQKYQIGDVVLTKLRGFPIWPSMIVDPEEVPEAVKRERPSATGFYCSRFFPAGDYAWSTTKDLKPLKSHEITAYLQTPNKKTSGDLYKAYQIAEDPSSWVNEKDEEAREIAENQDQLEEDAPEAEEEEDGETGKKRKRTAGAEKAGKKAKKAKVDKPKSKKSKDTVEEEDEIAEEAPSKKKESKPKSSNKKKDAAPAEEPEDADPLAKDPEAAKVKDWRHKLQRGFLSKSIPTADEMPGYDAIFKTIEEYEGMTVQYLSYSKIGKVMKKITALDNIPRNDEFKITERAGSLVQKYQDLMPKGDAGAAAEGAD